MSEDHNHQRLEQTASALEDLLYMDTIRLAETESDKAYLSPHFSNVISNVMETSSINKDTNSNEQVMNLMYYSLLVYMNEHLKVPRSLVMALGNDWERNRQSMESGDLITIYVQILSEIWLRDIKR
jgi:hypothetical protein